MGGREWVRRRRWVGWASRVTERVRGRACLGSGLKCRISWVEASRMSFWWSSDLRVFMMRTWPRGGVGLRGEG